VSSTPPDPDHTQDAELDALRDLLNDGSLADELDGAAVHGSAMGAPPRRPQRSDAELDALRDALDDATPVQDDRLGDDRRPWTADPAAATSSTPGKDPMAVHRKVVGVLTGIAGVTTGGLAALGGFVSAALLADSRFLAELAPVAFLLGLVGLAIGVGAVAAGIRFTRGRQGLRWIVWCVAVLSLLGFPIGTALGIYMIWVLMNTAPGAASVKNPSIRVA
jgi:hypothetical protein